MHLLLELGPLGILRLELRHQPLGLSAHYLLLDFQLLVPLEPVPCLEHKLFHSQTRSRISQLGPYQFQLVEALAQQQLLEPLFELIQQRRQLVWQQHPQMCVPQFGYCFQPSSGLYQDLFPKILLAPHLESTVEQKRPSEVALRRQEVLISDLT